MINNDSKSSVIGYRRRDNSPTVETTVLGSSEPISPAETQMHTHTYSSTTALKSNVFQFAFPTHTHTHTHLRFQCWRAAEGTCCFSAGVCVRWAAGCGYWQRSLTLAGSRAGRRGYCRGWTLPCHSWREADPAGQISGWLMSVRINEADEFDGVCVCTVLTQILCLLIIRSMSSLILRYLSSDSGLWPAESSASMSGLSQPFKPFLRSVWKKRHTLKKQYAADQTLILNYSHMRSSN